MKINRFLPILVPLFSFFLFQILFFWGKMIFIVLVLLNLLYLFTIRQFVLQSGFKDKWYNIIIWPFCFLLGTVIFCVLIPRSLFGDLLIQFIFLINSFFSYYYFKAIYLFLIKARGEKSQTLQNLSSYGLFLACYFFVSGIYGLQVFLNIKTAYLMLAVLLFLSLIVYQVFWSNKIDYKKNFHFLLIVILVLVELCWAVSFLTLSFYILGMVVAVSYYILIGMLRFYLTGKLNARLVRIYLIFGFSSIAIVLFTSRWIGHG